MDLATQSGADGLRREVWRQAPSSTPYSWIPYVVGASPLALLLIGFALVTYNRPLEAVVAGVLALAAVGYLALSAPRNPIATPRVNGGTLVRGTSAQLVFQRLPQRLSGVIVEGLPQSSPFGGSGCVGWALELSVSGEGVTLRDGETQGFRVDLGTGRSLHVAPTMLRVAERARVGDVGSGPIAAFVRAFNEAPAASRDAPGLVEWTDARVVQLFVGDRVEITAAVREVAGSEGYRELTGGDFETVDVAAVSKD